MTLPRSLMRKVGTFAAEVHLRTSRVDVRKALATHYDALNKLVEARQQLDSHISRTRQFLRQAALPSTDARSLELRFNNDCNWSMRCTRDRITNAISRLFEYENVAEALEAEYDKSLLQTPQEIARDLLGLLDDYQEIHVNPKTMEIHVVTEPITLTWEDEEYELGRFRIEVMLREEELPQISAVALEPNPAIGKNHITHPHVNEQAVCLGNAIGPIALACKQGRVRDVVDLIAAVLRNYNPESPYISLEDWKAQPCSDCDSDVTDSSCYACERSLCADCYNSCYHCGVSMCSRHFYHCESCGVTLCDEHSYNADDDSGPYCGSCQDSVNERLAKERRQDDEEA
jgi:hypothetical protein